MNTVLASVYSAILPSAPYVIATYAFVWVILFVFVAIIVWGTKKTERDIDAIEQRLERIAREHEREATKIQDVY